MGNQRRSIRSKGAKPETSEEAERLSADVSQFLQAVRGATKPPRSGDQSIAVIHLGESTMVLRGVKKFARSALNIGLASLLFVAAAKGVLSDQLSFKEAAPFLVPLFLGPIARALGAYIQKTRGP